MAVGVDEEKVQWITKPNAEQYKYAVLQIASDNFDPKNRIGRGGFGSVYKAMLNDGTLVALKVLSAQSEQGEPEFLKEIELLSGLDHVNLVKLYGSYTEGHHRILVYEYLENNSLAQTLVGAENNKLQCTWEIRSQICIGVALGLVFLHEEARPQIVHRDIKESNVLLDQNFTPKISDFGLARLFPNSMTHVNTGVAGTLARLFPNSMTHVNTGVAGTPGYVAPDYALTGTLTKKSDVYGFGVLLLEIVSGRPNGDARLPAQEQNLLVRAWKLYQKGELVRLVDRRLENCTIEACKYLKIGLLCAQERAKKRPDMSDVVKMLKGEIDVDKIKMPKPGKLITLFASKSSSAKYQPHGSLLGSCFCFR